MGDRGGNPGGGAVAPVAAKTRKRRAYLYIFNSIAAIASVLCVYVVNTVGTIRTIQILVGADTASSTRATNGHHDGYKSYYAPYLLREIAATPATVQARIDAVLASGKTVGYLEMDPVDAAGSGSLATSFRQDNCSITFNETTDRIYKEMYLAKTLVPMLLAVQGGDEQWPLVLATGVSTERPLQWFATYQLQTIMANIPARRDTMPTGTASYTNLTLSSLVLEPGEQPDRGRDALAKVSSTVRASLCRACAESAGQEVPAVHRLVSSRGFPFNAAPFDPVVIHSTTDTGAWNTSVVATGLQMVLQGFGGMYRGSQNEQANYKTFVWVLDPDPIQVVHTFEFVEVGRTKNSWAWGQALISGFLSCFQQGNVRKGLLDMYVLTDSVKSDCLSLFLAGASFIASRLHLRINPAVPVVIYLIVYSQRAAIVAAMGILSSRADVELDANEALNVVLSETAGLDMWMWHEKKDFNATVVFNELSWMLLGTCPQMRRAASSSRTGI
ncbi:hypothetical protein DYB32_002795 [Aphanomyces invadans]|uniref:Uncharacterized protein n=1 Tax=Aphanomyces invadans TaxID=157072 RepID=A0A3R6VPY1_9STRA|nr:hypothetical protein DYB32_002795 [Aphanomyces invadans]